MEILGYYSEKSKKVIFFSQCYLAISLVLASLQSFQPGMLYGLKMCFLADSYFLWKTYGPVNHYLIDA